MLSFEDWRDQFHIMDNTGIPDGHLEAEQVRARRVLRENVAGFGSLDEQLMEYCSMMDGAPWESESIAKSVRDRMTDPDEIDVLGDVAVYPSEDGHS